MSDVFRFSARVFLAAGVRRARPGGLVALGGEAGPRAQVKSGLRIEEWRWEEDMVTFGPPDTVPVAYKGRLLHAHKP
jgi:hypothetical protein